MRISKVEFINHNIFNNAVIDFLDSSGRPYENILFCGENGSGKTRLLESLYNLFNVPPINYEVTLVLEQGDHDKISDNIKLSNNAIDQTNIMVNLKKELILRKSPNGNYYQVEYNNGSVIKYDYGKDMNSNTHPLQHYLSSIIIKVKKNDKEPNIKTITTVTNLKLDSSEHERNSVYYAGELNVSQLLVDLQAQDANEFFNNKNGKTLIDDINYDRRVERLQNAFNGFFMGSIKLNRINNFDIEFENNGGKKFNIVDLSSGEKSIIQYGGFFLKNQKAKETLISFLDEPEQALHPLWEEQILSFYKGILTINNQQISQLFTITHSEHVVKDALKLSSLIIIMKRKSDGNIDIKRTTNLNTFPYSPTYSEIKYFAFNLYTTEFHEELYGYLSEINSLGVSGLDVFLINHGCVEKAWVGKKINSRGVLENVPKLNTRSICSYIRNFNHHPELRGNDNPVFSYNELQKSIDFMLELVNIVRLSSR